MSNNANNNDNNPDHRHDQHPHRVHLRVHTPRGLWSMTEPADAPKKPEYALDTKVQQVIDDARSVFHFAESDSKYSLRRGHEELDPHRTLASYHITDGTLLILTVQGGNA